MRRPLISRPNLRSFPDHSVAAAIRGTAIHVNAVRRLSGSRLLCFDGVCTRSVFSLQPLFVIFLEFRFESAAVDVSILVWPIPSRDIVP